MKAIESQDESFMRQAIRLARRGTGFTSPNPCVGAVMVRGGKVIGAGWHRRAGLPHAEIEALEDARKHGCEVAGATLYVTLEPCSTHGRTPPCTETILQSRLKRVVVAATDPNPRHSGRGIKWLSAKGIEVESGVMDEEATALNEGFNHWIVHQRPLVELKAAMTLDGKIATAKGESKWITGEASRKYAMKLRLAADAILVGRNTMSQDDPSLNYRGPKAKQKRLRRFVLDTQAQTSLRARVLNDEWKADTVIVTGETAPGSRVAVLEKKIEVWKMPVRNGRIDLEALLQAMGAANITRLLVEGGGEVHASFLHARLAHRAAFFYAPKILGGRNSMRAVAGSSVTRLDSLPRLKDVSSKWLEDDLCICGKIHY